MGNTHAAERRSKDPLPVNIDKPKAGIFKSQQSEDDHDILGPKSPDDMSASTRAMPVTNCRLMPYLFKWQGEGSDVYVCSDTFPMGNKIRMNKSEKDFVAIIDLPEGEHEFTYEVDGDTLTDNVHEIVADDSGKKHNKTVIREKDFIDLENELLRDPNDIVVTSDGYGQKVPEYKPNEKIKDPPTLPAHLLQVILNKDTPVSCEPTLLPEPNHVIVNHMYALSIKDGMMVLSTTHRYKKKSVTTLIYRPI